MDWLIKIFAGGFLQTVGGVLKPVFGFLNNYVDAKSRMHVSDNDTLAGLGKTAMSGVSNAESENAATRRAEGKWSPWVLTTIVGFMVPFGVHTWFIVLDSIPFHLSISDWAIVVADHKVGSWGVSILGRPGGMFEQTEHAVINSLFVGAASLMTGLGLIKALKR